MKTVNNNFFILDMSFGEKNVNNINTNATKQ